MAEKTLPWWRRALSLALKGIRAGLGLLNRAGRPNGAGEENGDPAPETEKPTETTEREVTEQPIQPEPSTEPAANIAAEPVAEPTNEHIGTAPASSAAPASGPDAMPTPQPIAEVTQESAAEPVEEAVNAAPQPEAEAVPEPEEMAAASVEAEPAPKPIAEPELESAQEQIVEPAAEAAGEPAEAAPEPFAAAPVEPEPAPKPIAEPELESAPEQIAEPAAEAAGEPAEAAPEPFAAAPAGPEDEPAQEPIAEIAQEPATEPSEEPAEAAPQPEPPAASADEPDRTLESIANPLPAAVSSTAAPVPEPDAAAAIPPPVIDEKAAARLAAQKKKIAEADEQSPFSVLVGHVYEGPLDLLLDLIRKQDIDIYDIPIARITAQFLAYVDRLKASDVDVAGEFIYTASLLIHIKSKMLLPRAPAGSDETNEDPRRELVERLLEHERFKNAAQMLQQKQLLEAASWTHSGAEEFKDDDTAEPEIAADTVDLVRIFRDILERARRRPAIDMTEDQVTVGQMIRFLARRLTMEDKPVALRRLLNHTRSERALIAMFLALLELVRLQAILLRQDRHFSEIFIKKHIGFETAMNEGLASTSDEWR